MMPHTPSTIHENLALDIQEYAFRLTHLMSEVDSMRLDDSAEHGNEEQEKFYTALSREEIYYPQLTAPELDKGKIKKLREDIEVLQVELAGIPDSAEKTLFFIIAQRLRARIENLSLIQKSG